MSKKSIGIVGGMGPRATLDMFSKILDHTDAHSDAEHIRVYIDCHTGIPDRTRAILEGGESPVSYIVESAQKLASIGADFLLIPCNTSHYFYEDIVKRSPIPVMHMIREAATAVKRLGVSRVGLLATDGTLQSKVYQRELEAQGVAVVCPTEAGQREVMHLIYDGVKAGAESFDVTGIVNELARMRAAGAERIVLGCTELPLGFASYGIQMDDMVDAADELAKAAVLAAGYSVK